MSHREPSPPLPPDLPEGPSIWQSSWVNTLGRLVALFVVFAFFAALIRGGTFYSANSMENMLRQSCVYATAAMGMTMIIISAGIDLSAGSIIALSVVVVAWVLNLGYEQAVPGAAGTKTHYLIFDYPNLLPVLALIAGVLAAMLAGLANGAMIVGLRLAQSYSLQCSP